MKSFRIFILVLLLSPISETFAEYDGTYWEVRRGDTLYAIARAVYPGSARQQARLRKDIIRLNQNVFAAGSRSLFIGLKLHMPAYVTDVVNSAKKPVAKKPAVKRPVKPVTGARLISSNQWKIKRGDTLYSIGRYFFPKSNRQQYKLRKEIVSLNPDVFGRGRGSLEIGMLLTLPGYLVKKESKSKMQVPLKPATGSQVVAPTLSKSKPAVKQIVTEPEARTDLQQSAQPQRLEPRPVKTKTTQRVSTSDYEDFYSISIGYSVGGDDALIASGGHDITFGSGAHIRFNYDGLWDNKQGLRIALGTQLDRVTAGNDSGELSQNYLQSLYIYNFSSSLVGIGLAYHDNIVFESDISAVVTTFEPDGAAGVAVIYEYKRLFGEHILGVSHTSLETDDSIGNTIDMSRTEIYYRWQF